MWPLPLDYVSLTREGQRQARVNAARQWRVPKKNLPNKSLKEKGELHAASVNFFDQYYLYPDEEADFDPLFYDEIPRKTPPFHNEMLEQWGSGTRNITIAPRGSAKSKLTQKDMLTRLLTASQYSIYYATSTKDNANDTALALKMQLQTNSRIQDDFAPDFPGGVILPARGEMPFSLDYMVLPTASRVRLVSVQGRLRGGRPRLFVIDDPEYDPKESTEMMVVRRNMYDLIFRIVLPMVMRPDCGVNWVGTFVSRRHYAWHAMQTKTLPDGRVVAEDELFDRWSRYLIRAAYEVETENGKEIRSCWPDMWPPTEEYKMRHPETAERVSLEEIEKQVGRSVFLSEYMGQPGTGEDAFFGILGDKHGYVFSGIDDELESNPRNSNTKITYTSEGETITRTMKDLLTELRLFMTIDTSYTAHSDSDFKVAALMGVDRSNNLFVLDLWCKQDQESNLIKNAFRIADKWRCPVIYAEVVKEGISAYNALMSVVQSRAKDMLDVQHLPSIKKLNPGQMRKEDKIATLGLRFEHGKIKLPLWAKNSNHWRHLFQQIDEFNPEARDGGLKHDDALDSVAMSMFIVSARSKLFNEVPREKTAVEMLREGVRTDKAGHPIIHGFDFSKVPISDILPLITVQTRRPNGGTRA